MSVRKFEDLIAWQKAQSLAVEIYKLFKENRDFSFKDQLQRATVSISNNIAEGFDRQSKAEFTRFLYIALGSASEVKSMLYLAPSIGYISDPSASELIKKTEEISMIIRGLIKSIKR